MKQKFFLFLAQRARLTAFFIIAALCCVTSAWADGTINSLPSNIPCYITNISYNTEREELVFDDSFMPDKSMERRYDNSSLKFQ